MSKSFTMLLLEILVLLSEVQEVKGQKDLLKNTRLCYILGLKVVYNFFDGQ
jgi:hypothetical protein